MPMSQYQHGFDHGVSVRGMPLLNTYGGDVYWVDSNAGSDTNKGTFKHPFSTIDKAISMCAANNGDVIMLKPGHAEDLSDATTFQVDTAGIKIVGLGNGADRPTFTYTGTGGSVEIDSANTWIENIILKASVSAVVAGVNVDADDCTLVGVEWDYDETGDDFLIMLDVVDAANCKVIKPLWNAESAAGAARAVHLDNADGFQCINPVSFGDYSGAVIESDTDDDTGDAGNVSTHILITGGNLQNDDTGGRVIDFDSANTGIISYNTLSGGSGGVATLIDPGSCHCAENYGVTATDVTGVVVPVTADT